MLILNDKQIHILQLAEKLFAENGFDGTSIRDIAKEANVNIAMISYYFGSKEKLLEYLIINSLQNFRIQIANVFFEEITPIEKIEKFIDLYLTNMNENKHIYQIIHFEISYKKRALDLSDFKEIKKNNLDTLTKIISEGQVKKVFKDTVCIPLIIPTIIGTFFNFHSNLPFFKDVLKLETNQECNSFINQELTNHIKCAIKSLLLYEN